jgi:hypothetical protein
MNSKIRFLQTNDIDPLSRITDCNANFLRRALYNVRSVTKELHAGNMVVTTARTGSAIVVIEITGGNRVSHYTW